MPLPEYILFVFFFFSFLQKTKLLLWSFFQVVNISYGAAISFLSDSPTFKGASLEAANQSPSSGKDAHRQPAKDTHVAFCVRRSYIKSFCRCDCTGCFFRSHLQKPKSAVRLESYSGWRETLPSLHYPLALRCQPFPSLLSLTQTAGSKGKDFIWQLILLNIATKEMSANC